MAPLAVVALDAQDALGPVVAVDPSEAPVREVVSVQGPPAPVQRTELGDVAGDRQVLAVLEQVPVEARVVVPLAALGELVAHEEQLLAGLA